MGHFPGGHGGGHGPLKGNRRQYRKAGPLSDAPYFYELCDREGLAVWAEIPFISRLSDSAAARENALLQLRELIKQNYNHPSICFWGIGNDVTMFGAEDWVEEALREMNALAKRLDPGRITVCSHMMTLAEDSPLSAITDGIGYNVYYGWYVGECSDMGVWLDELQQKQVPVPIAISEYGADGILTYQTGSPTRGDYSESYQSLYHEEMLAIIRSIRWCGRLMCGIFVISPPSTARKAV